MKKDYVFGNCTVCKKPLGATATVYLDIKAMSTRSFEFWQGRKDPRNYIFGEIKCHLGCVSRISDMQEALGIKHEI